MQEFSHRLEIPKAERMQVRDLKDLLKLIALNTEGLASKTAKEVYCYFFNGNYIYYVAIVIHDVGNYRGVPIMVYVETNLEPREFLWYNLKTGNVSSNKSLEPSNPEVKDSTIIYPIIVVNELPEFLSVWK